MIVQEKKENSMGERTQHSKQKSSVLQRAGISQDTSTREFAVIKYVPDCHIAVIYFPSGSKGATRPEAVKKYMCS